MRSLSENLEQNQPIAYKTIYNGFKSKHISHAYLLVGGVGTPLLDFARFIAQSLICLEPTPLSCQECINCLRIENMSYPDFILIDGHKESIKKEMIQDLQSTFSLESFEDSGKKVYIIHLLENASVSAVNSLLKFIEEPLEDVIAIFTTNNMSKILPTIISRCQVIRLKDYNPVQLRAKLNEQGYDSSDAYILSRMFTNLMDIEEYLKMDEYYRIKDLAVETMSCFAENKDVYYFLISEVNNQVYNKQAARHYLDIIELIYRDVNNYRNNLEVVFKDCSQMIEMLNEKILDCNDEIIKIILARGNIEVNANIALLIDNLFYQLLKGEK